MMYSLGKGYKPESFEIEFDNFNFLKKGSKVEINGELREVSAIRSIEYANKKVIVKGKLK